MNPLEGLDPVGAWLGPALALHFRLTWLIWVACLVAAVLRGYRQAHDVAPRLSGLRRAFQPPELSHLWVLPIYVWGYEALILFERELSGSSSGLVSREFSLVVLYEIFFALFVLVTVQTLAVAALRGDVRTLGLHGPRHTAAVAVILTLFLQISLYLMLSEVFSKQYGLPWVLNPG